MACFFYNVGGLFGVSVRLCVICCKYMCVALVGGVCAFECVCVFGNVCLCVLFVGCCVMLYGLLGRAYGARLCVWCCV